MIRACIPFSYLLTMALLQLPLYAAEISVLPSGSLQEAINDAANGDTLLLSEGVYEGNIDLSGKAITIRGVGRKSVIRGDGTSSVVRISSGETTTTIIDSVRITGGRAVVGGGIFLSNSSPQILRSYISNNRSSISGSGICITAGSSPILKNNVFYRNRRSAKSGDPHAIQVVASSPVIINNTIVRNDSNGIHLSGASEAEIVNNIIARNGAKKGPRRGRGICDFSSAESTIQNNLFFNNEISALLSGGRDYKKITAAQAANGSSVTFGDNIDGNPRFRKIRFGSIRKRSRAVNAGKFGSAYIDKDGSINDIGFTGGPDAP